MFGMYCWETKIPILYYIKKRSIQILHPLLKGHLEPGSIVYSDEHASYMCTMNMRSRLSYLGYYHFFINHSAVRLRLSDLLEWICPLKIIICAHNEHWEHMVSLQKKHQVLNEC
jgi:hypothetical protein